MAILGSFTKQSREVLDVDIDYATVLAGRTDTITAQSAEVSPAGLTVVSLTRNGSKVKAVVSAGSNNTMYKLTVLATSSAALIYEDEVNITVEDV